MHKYKLTYVNARGRAEVSRLLFAAAGVEYEDDRFEMSEWEDIKDKRQIQKKVQQQTEQIEAERESRRREKKKEKREEEERNQTPLGQVPVLEIDGAQSDAHYRYLAKIFGFSGSNDLENLQCDVITNTCDDFRIPYIHDLNMAHYFAESTEKEEAAKEKLLNEGLPKLLPVFETFLSDYGCGSGYAVGSKLTYADFSIYEILELAVTFWPDILEKYPKLAENRKLVESNPKVKAYLEKRPKTFG